MSNISKTFYKDFARGVQYYLTYDFYPYGGKPVKLSRFEKRGGSRFECAVFKDESGNQFAVPKSNGVYLYSEDPMPYENKPSS